MGAVNKVKKTTDQILEQYKEAIGFEVPYTSTWPPKVCLWRAKGHGVIGHRRGDWYQIINLDNIKFKKVEEK